MGCTLSYPTRVRRYDADHSRGDGYVTPTKPMAHGTRSVQKGKTVAIQIPRDKNQKRERLLQKWPSEVNSKEATRVTTAESLSEVSGGQLSDAHIIIPSRASGTNLQSGLSEPSETRWATRVTSSPGSNIHVLSTSNTSLPVSSTERESATSGGGDNDSNVMAVSAVPGNPSIRETCVSGAIAPTPNDPVLLNSTRSSSQDSENLHDWIQEGQGTLSRKISFDAPLSPAAYRSIVYEGIVTDKYDVIKILGSGSFGSVALIREKEIGEFRKESDGENAIKGCASMSVSSQTEVVPGMKGCFVREVRTPGKLFAAKAMKKRGGVSSFGRLVMEEIWSEVDVMRRLRHEKLLRLYEVVDEPKRVVMVTEFAKGGDLIDWFSAGVAGELEIALAIADVAEGLNYLHSHNIAHRDLKPENLLVVISDTHSTDVGLQRRFAKVVIADFGFARVQSKKELLKTMCGSPMYVAPEVVGGPLGPAEARVAAARRRRKMKEESSEMSYERWTAAETFLDVPHDRFPVHAARRLHPADTDACSETSSYSEDEGDKAGYGIACDLWSLGVICYLLLCGYPPFNGRTATQTLRMIRRGTYTFPPREWKSVSDNAKDLIKRLLEPDVETRLRAEGILCHPWIKWARQEQRRISSGASESPMAVQAVNERLDLETTAVGTTESTTVLAASPNRGSTGKALFKAASNLRALRSRFRTGVLGVIAMRRLEKKLRPFSPSLLNRAGLDREGGCTLERKNEFHTSVVRKRISGTAAGHFEEEHELSVQNKQLP